MALFRRGVPPAPAPPPVVERDPDDDPQAIAAQVWKQIRFVNASAGKLPTSAVVEARGVTDTLREILATSVVRPLDVHTVVAVRGIVSDYLPTTLQRFLSLDPALLDRPGVTGETPVASLDAQLRSLQDAADRVLDAARAQDVDALMTQGTFLRTKFSRSDLDL